MLAPEWGQARPIPAQSCPVAVEAPELTECGPKSTGFERARLNFGQNRPGLRRKGATMSPKV